MRTTTAEDIVLDILDRIALKVGIVPPRVARELEREIRRDWGGESHYVAKRGESGRAERLERDTRIRAEHRRGEHVPLLARRYGLSEMRIRQILAESASAMGGG